MAAEVTKRHRELAYERFGQKPPIPEEQRWLETGEDEHGYFYLTIPRRVAQLLADLDATRVEPG